MTRTILILTWNETADDAAVSQKTAQLCQRVLDSLLVYGLETVSPVYQEFTEAMLETVNL